MKQKSRITDRHVVFLCISVHSSPSKRSKSQNQDSCDIIVKSTALVILLSNSLSWSPDLPTTYLKQLRRRNEETVMKATVMSADIANINIWRKILVLIKATNKLWTTNTTILWNSCFSRSFHQCFKIPKASKYHTAGRSLKDPAIISRLCHR